MIGPSQAIKEWLLHAIMNNSVMNRLDNYWGSVLCFASVSLMLDGSLNCDVSFPRDSFIIPRSLVS